MLIRKGCVVFVPVLLMAGCGDAFFWVTQPVEIEVRSVESGEPGANAVVEVGLTNSDNAEPVTGDVEALALFGYRQRTTDASGRATLDIDIGRIAPVILLRPTPFDPAEDTLTGVRALVRVTHAEQSEAFFVLLEPGEQAGGQSFAVTILSIGPGQLLNQEESEEISQARWEADQMENVWNGNLY